MGCWGRTVVVRGPDDKLARGGQQVLSVHYRTGTKGLCQLPSRILSKRFWGHQIKSPRDAGSPYADHWMVAAARELDDAASLGLVS